MTAEIDNNELRLETRLSMADPRFLAPTAEEVRLVLRRLVWNAAETELRLGVDDTTLQSWVNGDARISYSAWRTMLIEAGLTVESMSAPLGS